MTRAQLVAQLAARIGEQKRDHPVRVAIDGVDVAGKTTLADELAVCVQQRGRPVVRASIDGFHNPARIRRRRGDSPEGYYRDSFDYDALVCELLVPLGPGGSRRYRRAVFDFRSDTPVCVPLEDAAADAILLFDGVFLLRPELQDYWDFSVFVDADFSVTMQRAERRDQHLFGTPQDVRRRYETRYVPGQQLYLAEAQPRLRASVVIQNDDPNAPVLQPGGRSPERS